MTEHTSMIAHRNDLPTPRIYPVYVTDAHGPHDFAVTVIGDPDAAPGAVQVHVVYPTSGLTVSELDYPLLVRCFATHLLAHAAQYEAAQAASTAGSAAP
jgi:hypothetical protein